MTKKTWVGDSGAGLDYDDNPTKAAVPHPMIQAVTLNRTPPRL